MCVCVCVCPCSAKVNRVVCSADRWRLEALLSGTWSLPRQTKKCVCACMCVRDACVSARAHAGERVAAKCHCVPAKTSRLNEKQLLGQRGRK